MEKRLIGGLRNGFEAISAYEASESSSRGHALNWWLTWRLHNLRAAWWTFVKLLVKIY